MADVSDKIESVDAQGEFRVCPACEYQRGFHVSLITPNKGEHARVVLVLICPNCGARYDVGKQL